MEKLPVINAWKRRLDTIYNSIQETDEPDVKAMDDALTSVLEMIVIFGKKLEDAFDEIQILESQVESLSMVKDVKDVLAEASKQKQESSTLYL